jgi:hypothetical protein
MTTFSEREKAFENKFAHEEAIKFKIRAYRNRLAAKWAAALSNLSEADTEAYIEAILDFDIQQADKEMVVKKIKSDLEEKNVKVLEEEVKNKIAEFTEEARNKYK